MDQLLELMVAAVVIFLVQVAPAFAPPNWAIVAAFRLHGLPLIPLGIVAAASATAGRVCLALAARRLRGWLPARQQRNVAAVGAWLSKRRRARTVFLVAYCGGPFPSNVLFIAAGGGAVGIRRAAVAFFLTRCVTDTFWAWVGSEAAVSVRGVFLGQITSWSSIALQLAAVVGGGAFFALPWDRWLGTPPDA